MMDVQPLKPVDLAVGLRLAQAPEAKYEQLSADLGISASAAHASVRRLQAAGLLRPSSRVVNRLALGEFLEHGVRYAFPAHPGAEVRGVPTAHAAPPLADRIVAEDVLVWPSVTGPARGRAIAPLYPRATELPRRCPSLYESLALVDALRVGRVRERKLALEAIRPGGLRSVMAPRGPAIDRVAAVATDLGDLATRVVFIGGAIAPLLQTDPPFPRARVTSDVDGVVASSTYAESERLHRELAKRGFRQAISDTKQVHRWIGPSGIPFDLVPAGQHLGGSGNPWDTIAIETAVEATIGRGVTIRHASAPAFLAQKWAAHHDRGRADPLGSHDLEDILALLASRPTILEEVAAAPAALRTYVAEQAKTFLADANAEDLLAAHLNNAQDPAATTAAVRAMLERLSGR